MRIKAIGILFLFCALSSHASWFGSNSSSNADSEDAFKAATTFFNEPGKDLKGAVQALKKYIHEFPKSAKALDARFLIGEASMEEAVNSLKSRAQTPQSGVTLSPPSNLFISGEIRVAERAFKASAKADRKTGLGASAQYRLGELAYDQKHWNRAIQEFKKVETNYPQSYITPEALMGIVFTDIALKNYPQAEIDLVSLGEDFPIYLKNPSLLYSEGIIALRDGNYPQAEKILKTVDTNDALYYLGLTYLLSNRPYLAASTFEKLRHADPNGPLQEETQLLLGDAFFLSKDYDGAIVKYQSFLTTYPKSPLDSAATFRLGSSFFKKKDYQKALSHFQDVLAKYPNDFFAPLAQYFIAESYLNSNQMRYALFAYTKATTRYPQAANIIKLARYKLAWTQYQLGDFAQTVQDCHDFLSIYPTDALAKDASLIEGNAFKKLGRNDEAITAFQHILDLAPNSEVAEQALFSILQDEFDQKSYYSIITSYQFIFRHLPPSQSQWRILSDLYAAEAYLSLNRPSEAKDIYKMTLKLYPDSPYALYAQDGLAWAYTYAGEDEKALAARQKLKDMMSLLSSTTSFSGASEMGIADSLFNQKKYESAYELYARFIKENPRSPEVPKTLYHEGLSLYHMRYYTQAVEAWNKLADDYPKSPEAKKASFLAADTLFRAQKYSEAIALYQRIIHDYVDSGRLPLAHLRIAQSYFNDQKDADAIQETQTLVTSFPKSQEALDSLDLLDSIFDRSEGVDYKKILDSIIEPDPTSPAAAEATYRLARRAFDAKDYETAADYFQKFSVRYTDHPRLARAQFYLGESYFALKKYQDAIAPMERFVNNFSSSQETPIAIFHLASCFYALKQYADAAKNYARLLRDYPGSDYEKPAEFNLALTYKNLGQLDLSEKAYGDYAKTVGANTPDGRAADWEIYGIQKQQRNYDDALNTLNKLKASATESAQRLETLYREGEIYDLMARPDEELNILKEMEPLEPSNNPFRLQALIKLGEMYEKYNDFSDASAVYKDLAKSASGDLARQAKGREAAMLEQAKAQGSPKTAIPIASDEKPGSDKNPPQTAPPDELPGMK